MYPSAATTRILQFPLQIHHIYQLYPALVDRVVVVVSEKVLDQTVSAKAAGFLEGDGGGAISGSHLQHRILSCVGSDEKVHYGFSIALALSGRLHSEVFQF